MLLVSKKQSLAVSGLLRLSPFTGTMLVSIGAYIVTARALGPAAFGIFTFMQWLATIVLPLVGIGMSAMSSSQIVELQSREPPRGIAGIFHYLCYQQCKRILLYCLIYLLLALPLAWIFDFCTPLRLLLACLGALPFFLSSTAGITLRSLRRLDLLTGLHLFGAVTSLLLVVIALQLHGGQIEIFLLATALSGTLTLVIAVLSTVRILSLRQAQPPALTVRNRLKGSFKQALLPFVLDAIIWQRGASLFLAWWCSPTELAFYIISAMISSSLMRLTPLLLSNLPFFARYTPGRHSLDSYDTFIKTSCYMAFLAVALCMAVTLLGPYLIISTLGESYLPLLQPLRILLLASVFGSVASVSLTHLTRHKQQSTYFDGIAALLHIALAVPCIIYWGATGAALASALAQILSAIGSIITCERFLSKLEMSTRGDAS
ncbi:MAG: hypothetical protein IMW89_04585 [Ktedonobacteraceae bacterium]|nr:hypothetical protein [Ktedonobacteraceae bacterium]